MQKFSAWHTCAPDRNNAGSVGLSLVNLADERWQDMRGAEVEVVIRTVEVRRHAGDEVFAVLLRVGLAEFDAGDFG